MSGEEQKYIKEAFDTNWVVPLGPNVNGFEADLEAFKVINQAYGEYLATLENENYKLPSNWTIDGDPNTWRNDAK